MSIIPGKLDFPLYRFAGNGQNKLEIDFVGYDFSNAIMRCEFRDYKDQSGNARITATNDPNNGISVGVSTKTIQEGDVTYTATVTNVAIQIQETAVEAITASGAPIGGIVPLVWDLQITTDTLGKVRWLEGAAPIYSGVTQGG